MSELKITNLNIEHRLGESELDNIVGGRFSSWRPHKRKKNRRPKAKQSVEKSKLNQALVSITSGNQGNGSGENGGAGQENLAYVNINIS